MSTYVSLVNFTDQGIRDIKESPKRYDAFKTMAEKVGVTVKGVYYTVGSFDLVLITEGTDEGIATALLQHIIGHPAICRTRLMGVQTHITRPELHAE